MSFWHVNEYLAAQRCNWHTRIGKFNFQGGGRNTTSTPTATPTATPAAAGRPVLTCPRRSARLASFSLLTASFTSWAAVTINNVELTNPFEYDPGSNSWTTKSATYPDNSQNNMACGVLTDAERLHLLRGRFQFRHTRPRRSCLPL